MDTAARRRGGRESGDNLDEFSRTDSLKHGNKRQQHGLQSPKRWHKILISLTASVLILIIIIALLPCPIDPVAYSLPPPPEWTGPLSPNNKLTQADRIYENQLQGAESIVIDGDYMYTGTSDGRIVSIYKGEITTLARLGKGTNCGTADMESVCGRPLGMRLDRDGYLLVADAYLGIFKVNVATGDVHRLLSSQDPMAGRIPKLLNDIEEGPDGTVYFTDSSTRWQRYQNRLCVMEAESSGRLLAYNPETQVVQEVMSDLAFANGITISYDKTHILVVETTKARIWRYYISGPKKGEKDIFADNLPGIPDNIRRSGRGTYWVGMAIVRRPDKLSLTDIGAPRPWLRSLILKLFSPEVIISLSPKYGLLVELNNQGHILRSLHDPTGVHVPAVSEAEEKNGVLYLGSYYLPFITRVYLHKK